MRDIFFVTDFVCPYCIVAEEALRQAIQETGIEAEIRFWPMELTEEPKERADTYNDPVRREHYKVLDGTVKELGLDVKFPPKVIPRPYTRLAWEGWHYAKEKGLGGLYADRMYHAYFTNELDIGELDVLVKLAEEIGLDAEEYRKVLEEGVYFEEEKSATAYSRNTLQVKSIPTIYLDGRVIEVNDYTKEEMIRILMEESENVGPGTEECGGFAEESASGDGWTDDGSGCGPNGCSL